MNFNEISGTAVASVQETFKRVYLMAVDLVPDMMPLTAQMKKTRKFRAAPDGLYFNAKMQIGGKVANVNSDGALLPPPSAPVRKTGKTNIVHTYTVVAVGGQSIPLTDNTRNAFVSNLEDQLDDGLTRIKLDVERQYNGDGRGILALVETVGSAPTYDVYRPFGKTGAGPGTMHFVEGMEIAFVNPANGVERGRGVISTIDTANETITLAASIAGAAIGDYIVLVNGAGAAYTGSDATTNYLNEAQGIQAVVASGDTFENINGATYRYWNGNTLSNGGTARPISEKLIAQGEARTLAKSGKKPTHYYTTRGIVIELADQLAARRRDSNVSSTTLKGGYEAVEINGRTIMPGDFCPKGHFFGMNLSAEVAGMMDLVALGYVDLDGAKLHRVEGRHAYRADCWFPHGAIWFARAAHFVLTDLEDDNTITR